MKKDSPVIATGISVSPGTITGPVKIVKNPTDVNKIQSGDIMVVEQSSPAFAIGVMNAAGLICAGGGMLTHICIVARELGIPCLARVGNATTLLHESMTVTLDASKGEVRA